VSYYEELLKLCGFEDEDINRERARVERTFNKLGLVQDDMKRAQAWVRQNHDVTMIGVRKLLRAWILELTDMVLAREEGKKIVYYGFPSIKGPGMAIKVASTIPVYVGCPDVVLCHTLGQIFNKLSPILEAAEKGGLPPGHGLCSLQQIRNGGMALDIIPIPDLIAGSSYYCDMGSKADELLHEKYHHRAIYVDGSMDTEWGAWPEYDPERVKYLGAQINKLFDTVKEVLGIDVNQQAQDKALNTSRELFSALGNLTRLMTADPMPISSVEQGLAVQLATASTGRSMTEGPEAINILCREVQEKVNQGVGVVEKGAPRIISFIQPFSDPSISHMMENAGLALTTSLITVPPPKRKPGVTFNSMGEERAEFSMRDGYYHSGYSFAKKFAEAAKDLKVDGVVWGYLFNCRPLAIGSHLVKHLIEEQTGIPTLSLEMDIYDSRSYNAESLKTRVEAFAEMLRARKAVAAAN